MAARRRSGRSPAPRRYRALCGQDRRPQSRRGRSAGRMGHRLQPPPDRHSQSRSGPRRVLRPSRLLICTRRSGLLFRLHQQMVDDETGKVVDKEDKGRGYEVSKGKYVEIEPEELDAIRVESTHTIEIDSFVPKDEIDQRYLDKPYYIVPGGEKIGEEAFAVIRDAMKDKGRVALGRIVMANREHVIAIQPIDKGLLGTTLRYLHELRDAGSYFHNIRSPRLPRDMVRLAEHILDSKAGRFDPSRFKDEYEN